MWQYVLSPRQGKKTSYWRSIRKWQKRYFVFFLTILFLLCNIFIFLKSVIFDNNLFGTVSTQFGLNITQICLAEDCSEDEVRYQWHSYPLLSKHLFCENWSFSCLSCQCMWCSTLWWFVNNTGKHVGAVKCTCCNFSNFPHLINHYWLLFLSVSKPVLLRSCSTCNRVLGIALTAGGFFVFSSWLLIRAKRKPLGMVERLDSADSGWFTSLWPGTTLPLYSSPALH